MKPPKGQIGLCKLTGQKGKMVKSHLIPRALARPGEGGIGFPQFGGNRRPIRRLDSWYDTELVVQAGEDILTDLDTFGIKELRRLKLVWQAFGPMLHLATNDYESIPGMPNGIRRVQFIDAERMRLFFLSLLWRAAATDLPEFKEVVLKPSDQRRLRGFLRDQSKTIPLAFFPITLTQIATRGDPHNHAPVSQIKESFNFMGFKTKQMPIFRFYLDGLVVHFHNSANHSEVDDLLPMLVGPPAGTTLPAVSWDRSWQLENMINSVNDAEHEFPGAIARIEGSRASAVKKRSSSGLTAIVGMSQSDRRRWPPTSQSG